MSEKIIPNIIMDLKGLSCPLPLAKVNHQIKKMKPGEIIEAETTDPGALLDFPAWASASGNEIVNIDKGENSTRFYIKKS